MSPLCVTLLHMALQHIRTSSLYIGSTSALFLNLIRQLLYSDAQTLDEQESLLLVELSGSDRDLLWRHYRWDSPHAKNQILDLSIIQTPLGLQLVRFIEAAQLLQLLSTMEAWMLLQS
eukprot:CAMPEP_0113231288 /NCGR_PEP_ID=MMETSP0008_2-20120614/1342_1 /TAXON_ID=97485 /ORGANISM="Prymnesium parvum" /LENGTH=117 /DNA_ID=CAMNT_0000077937 /DNA_START=622 /DNA_END=972 /DNA_ORIENTATION=+ /assembly_acc=CAM_ASM_000153